MVRSGWVLAVAGIGLGMAAQRALRQARQSDLHGQVAVIAGGSRGLGLALAAQVLTLVERLLPAPGGDAQQAKPGWQSRGAISDSGLTTLGERAADDLNQR